MMNPCRFSLVLSALALLLFCAQPALAHCGKCGMGEEKGEHQMEQMRQHKMEHMQEHMQEHMAAKCNCEDCSMKDACACGCAMHKDSQHGCNCGMKEQHHGQFKCSDCEKAGHHGHHDMHQQGDDGGKLDELFEKDKSK